MPHIILFQRFSLNSCIANDWIFQWCILTELSSLSNFSNDEVMKMIHYLETLTEAEFALPHFLNKVNT